MNPALATLTQSKFYSPAFNAAIFDGPLRIYFAQYQESLALEIYFRIQQVIKGLESDRQKLKNLGYNIFVMLYPSAEVYGLSFDAISNDSSNVSISRMDNDFVFGINSTINEDGYKIIFNHLETVLR